MNSIKTNFFKTPNKIFELNLKPKEFVVLSYLISLSSNEKIYPSRKTISRKTFLSKSSVDRALQGLVKKGYVRYNRGFLKENYGHPNQYSINFDKISSNSSSFLLEKSRPLLSEECDKIISNSFNRKFDN